MAAARTIDGDGLAASALERAASDIGTWLDADAPAEMDRAAALLEPAHGIIVIARAMAFRLQRRSRLKIKEASYRHAEGFGAGEFRHGSTAILEPLRGMLGLSDASSRTSVAEC